MLIAHHVQCSSNKNFLSVKLTQTNSTKTQSSLFRCRNANQYNMNKCLEQFAGLGPGGFLKDVLGLTRDSELQQHQT